MSPTASPQPSQLPDLLDRVTARLGRAAGGGVLAVSSHGREAIHPFGQVTVRGAVSATLGDDRFALTSITKPFTALQILCLVDDGLLDLDAPVADYLPEFASNGKGGVTCRHILTHTSGVDPSANTAEGPPTSLDARGHLAEALGASLSTRPGKVFAYCSPTYWALGELIARLSGMSYAEHLERRVTGPLGAETIGYHPVLDPPFRLVHHVAPPGREHNNEHTRLVSYPAGGLAGAAGDLLALGRCMLARGEAAGGRVVSSAAVELMLRPTSSGWIGGRRVRWGLGWELGGPGSLQSPDGLYHAGASGVAFWIDPSRELAVAALTDTWGVPRRVFAEAINGVVGGLDLLSAR